eukprot:392026_1
MPSLPTRNDCPESCRDSFRRYLPQSYQQSFESHGESELKVFGSFFQFMFTCILMVLLLLLPNWVFMIIQNNINKKYWNKYQLHYIHDFYWYWILSLYSYCFTKLCYKKMAKEHIKHPLKLFNHHWKLSLYIISALVTILMYTCNTILYYFVKQSKITGKFHIFCSIVDCNKQTISSAWEYVFTPSATLLINSIVIHSLLFGILTIPIISKSIQCCFPQSDTSNNIPININEYEYKIDQSSTNESMSVKLPLNYSIASDVSIPKNNTENSLSHINRERLLTSSPQRQRKHVIEKQRQKTILEKGFKKFQKHEYPEILLLRYILLYAVCYLLLSFGYWVTSLVQKNVYINEFETVYVFVLTFISINKLILKRIARLIDSSRSNITQRHKHFRNAAKRIKSERKHKSRKRTQLSMELMTELFMSIIYWFAYRELTMYSVPGWNTFLKAQSIHMLSEFIATSVRPSEIYYNITKKLQNICCEKKRIHNHNHKESISSNSDCVMSVDDDDFALKTLVNWKDDSTLSQWKIRHSLDIIMRMIASVVSASAIITQVFLLGSNQYGLTQQKFIRGIEYLVISLLIEVIYFIIVHIMNELYRFNLLTPFWAIYRENRSLLIFVCSILICQAFWEPDL